jgi:hypothetical protein
MRLSSNVRPHRTPTVDSLLEELKRLEVELHHPGVRCSSERLQQLLHPEFREVGRSGRPYDRETVITHLLSQTARSHVVSTDFQISRLCETCALLTYRSATAESDERFVQHALRSSVWVRTHAGWQMYYHQGTPYSPQ